MWLTSCIQGLLELPLITFRSLFVPPLPPIAPHCHPIATLFCVLVLVGLFAFALLFEIFLSWPLLHTFDGCVTFMRISCIRMFRSNLPLMTQWKSFNLLNGNTLAKNTRRKKEKKFFVLCPNICGLLHYVGRVPPRDCSCNSAACSTSCTTRRHEMAATRGVKNAMGGQKCNY